LKWGYRRRSSSSTETQRSLIQSAEAAIPRCACPETMLWSKGTGAHSASVRVSFMLRVPRMTTSKHFDSWSRITVKAGFRIWHAKFIFSSNAQTKTHLINQRTLDVLSLQSTSSSSYPAAHRSAGKRLPRLQILARFNNLSNSCNSFKISRPFTSSQSLLSRHSLPIVFLSCILVSKSFFNKKKKKLFKEAQRC